MGCQKRIPSWKIVGQDADYLLAVKGNQKRLGKRLAKCLILVCLIVLTAINTSLKRKDMVVQKCVWYGCFTIRNFLGDIALDWARLFLRGMKSFQFVKKVISQQKQCKSNYISSAKLTAKALLESSRNIRHRKSDALACLIRRRFWRWMSCVRVSWWEFSCDKAYCFKPADGKETSFKAGIKVKQKKANRKQLPLASYGARGFNNLALRCVRWIVSIF